MNRGQALHRLQTLDLELETIQRRSAAIQASLSENETLLLARQAVIAAEKEHRKWMIHTRDLELEIEGLGSKISSSERRLYGGRVINPKELNDLQGEITSLKRRCKSLEDQVLEAMVHGEAAEAALEQSRAGLADAEALWQANQSTLMAESAELEQRLSQLHIEREHLRQRIAPEDLATYDKLRARFGAIAVSALRDGVCNFCAVAPSSTKLKAIRSGNELLPCGNCGRILVTL
jgi:hypothetical protein